MLYTVNQILFAATLFCDSSVMNWLVASNFRDQAFSIHTKLHKHLVRSENIRDGEVLANLVKISCSRIKVVRKSFYA
jgi:hypothetical protein